MIDILTFLRLVEEQAKRAYLAYPGETSRHMGKP